MTLIERIRKVFFESNEKQKNFSDATGYSERNLSNVLNGRTKNPGIDLLTAISSHFPNVNLKWLLHGEGEMYTNRSSGSVEKSASDEQLNWLKQKMADQLYELDNIKTEQAKWKRQELEVAQLLLQIAPVLESGLSFEQYKDDKAEMLKKVAELLEKNKLKG